MTMRSRAIAAAVAAAILGVLALPSVSVGASPASSTDTAGKPVAVSSPASSGYAKTYYLQDASARWVVFSVLGTVYAEPATGGALVPLPDVQASDIFPGDVTVDGDSVLYPSSSHRGTDSYDLATRTLHKGNARWAAVSPDGGVFGAYDATDRAFHGYDQDAATGAVTDLGVLKGLTKAAYVSALADESGVVFFESYGSGHNRAFYVAFDHPGTVTPLQTHHQGSFTCRSLTSNALGCASGGDTVYRVPLDGSAAQSRTISLPKHAKASGAFSLVYVTPARTYWAIDYDEDSHEGYDGPAPEQPIRSVPADHPHAKPLAGAFTLPYVEGNVVASRATLYFGAGSAPGKAGIYRLTSDHVHRTGFHLVGPERLLAKGLALGTGQAVFEDNSRSGVLGRLRTRLFTRSGNTVSPGRIVDLRNDVDDVEPVFTSGSRVLVATGNGDDVTLLSAAGTGNAHAGRTFTDVEPRGLSGDRALLLSYRNSHGVAHLHMNLVNLVTGHRTDLSKKYGVRGTPALFGDYVAYGTKNGSIRRLDLASNKSVLVAGPTRASRGRTPRRVVEWGDYVAWDYSTGTSTYSSFLRNARTMSPRVALPSHDFIVGASADGVTLRTAGTKTKPTLVRPWTSGTTRTVYAGRAFVASSVAAHTKDAGDPDQPGGTFYARPLRHAADRPRSLGNPFGAATVRRGHAWHFDLPTSAALTSCTVRIRRHGHTVRTLSCGRTLMQLGEVSVTWKGRRGKGHDAARGRYHVIVSASNADGTLLGADGSHAAIGTTVTVR